MNRCIFIESCMLIVVVVYSQLYAYSCMLIVVYCNIIVVCNSMYTTNGSAGTTIKIFLSEKLLTKLKYTSKATSCNE